jgi:hypothetical protein
VTTAVLCAALRGAASPGPELAAWLEALPKRPDRLRAWPLPGPLPHPRWMDTGRWPVATLAVPYQLHQEGVAIGPVWVMVYQDEPTHPLCRAVAP